MTQWSPKSQWEAETAKRLPEALRRRLGGQCGSVIEAEVSTSLGGAAAGVSGMILVALYCYKVPIQVGQISVHGVVDMLLDTYFLHSPSGNKYQRVRAMKRKKIEARRNGVRYSGEQEYKFQGVSFPLNGNGEAVNNQDGESMSRAVWDDLRQLAGQMEKRRRRTGLRKTVKQSEGWLGEYGCSSLTANHSGSNPRVTGRFIMEAMANNEVSDTEFFPLKGHPGARTKVNVYLGDVLRDIRKYYAGHPCTLR